ncbi:MAG: glycerophosphodiester phosphodiesterase [Anaerolineales bacterium]
MNINRKNLGKNMPPFEIVAHRGVPNEYPENTLAAFERAIEMGADAIELDVRLTKDKIPVVYHYYYLQMITTLSGPIFTFTYEQLKAAKYKGPAKKGGGDYAISTFEHVLEKVGGRTGLEIEIKGPELESVEIIGSIMSRWKPIWDSVEMTSYEPFLLHKIKERCPGITTDLLIPPTESWMDLDVVTYRAIHLGKLAGARAIHLHPTQLTEEIVRTVRDQGLEVHAWDINDLESLQLVSSLGIPKFTTDELQQVLDFRYSLKD